MTSDYNRPGVEPWWKGWVFDGEARMAIANPRRVTVQPDIPEGSVLDTGEQDMGHLDVWWVVMPDGTRTAVNKNPLLCPTCTNTPGKRENCETCSGRGKMFSVPFCDRPWDEVTPNLWLGGHDCQMTGAPNGDALPGDNFDLIVSLHQRWTQEMGPSGPEDVLHPDWQPANGAEVINYTMADADLDPEHHTALDALAEKIDEALYLGKRVLVRCRAGINRSALVVGLVMLQEGWTADQAIARMREVRSPYVLFNQSFADYLREVEDRAGTR